MKTKTIMSLLLLIMSVMLVGVTTVSASPVDEYLIEKAIYNVELDHVDDLADIDVMWSGEVTSWWGIDRNVFIHKDVLLNGVFGWYGTGSVMWTGGVSLLPFWTIDEQSYIFVPAKKAPPTNTAVSYLGDATRESGYYVYNLRDVILPDDWEGKYPLHVRYTRPDGPVHKTTYMRKQTDSLTIYIPETWWSDLNISITTDYNQILVPTTVKE